MESARIVVVVVVVVVVVDVTLYAVDISSRPKLDKNWHNWTW
ncbi:MAG TPA: hypothetical protein VIP70_10945 [Nitrososphaeraceae archaeon]